ncbi:MAG: dienelactone hydrolase [Celeribacter sp.]|jgi:dienelactone hydrolase
MTVDIRFDTPSGTYSGDLIQQGRAKTVLVLPDWRGHRTEYAMRRGVEIAQVLDCTVVVSDLYGTENRPKGYGGDAEMWIAQALGDPQTLRRKLATYIQALCDTVQIDPQTLHVVGYCLGGALSFEIGRADTGLAAVASVHGIPSSQDPIQNLHSNTRFLAIHGASDPIISMDHLSAFQSEMTDASVDWMSLSIGHARHGFTNEEIDPHGAGQRYDARAARRCLTGLRRFLYEEAS